MELNKLLIIFFVIYIFVEFPKSTFANEKTVEEYSRILKKGRSNEKLLAAQEIVKYQIFDSSFAAPLLKQLKRGKDSAEDFVYLSAYVRVVSETKLAFEAYKEFSKNAFSKKWPRGTNVYDARNFYLAEMVNLDPLPQSLIDFLFDENYYKDISGNVRIWLLSELLKKNPELAPKFVARLNQTPVTNLRILSSLSDDKLAPYIENIRAVITKAPANVLDMLQKHNAITEKEIEFATTLLGPLSLENVMWGSRTANIIALEILAANVGKSELADAEILKLVDENNIYAIRYVFDKYPLEQEDFKKRLLDAFFIKLTEKGPPNTVIKSEICKYLANFKITQPEHVESLLFAARYADNVVERNECNFALYFIQKPTDNLFIYLNNALLSDLEFDVENSTTLENKKYEIFSISNLSIQNPYEGPDVSPLYRAGLMLRYDPTHKVARDVVEKFYYSKASFIKTIVQSKKDRLNEYFYDVLSFTLHDNHHKIPIAVNFTPTEILAEVYKSQDEVLWQDFLYKNISANNYDQAAITAFIILENRTLLPEKFTEKILEKCDYNDLFSPLFISTLEYTPRNEKTEKYLNKKLSSDNDNIRQAAKRILSIYANP